MKVEVGEGDSGPAPTWNSSYTAGRASCWSRTDISSGKYINE